MEKLIKQKKFDVRIFCFRLRRLKTLVLKNHYVREVGCFLRAGHILCSTSRDKCVYYDVFQTSLDMKRKLTLRNMNGRLYCCYQNSPCQLCPHILVFVFKNYIPHRQTDGQTDRHTQTHTHTQYVYYYKNVSIILMFTYENKKYTRSSKRTM